MKGSSWYQSSAIIIVSIQLGDNALDSIVKRPVRKSSASKHTLYGHIMRAKKDIQFYLSLIAHAVKKDYALLNGELLSLIYY